MISFVQRRNRAVPRRKPARMSLVYGSCFRLGFPPGYRCISAGMGCRVPCLFEEENRDHCCFFRYRTLQETGWWTLRCTESIFRL